MNYIDVKITTWERYHFDDSADMQAIKQIVEEGSFLDVIDDDYGFTESEPLYEIEEPMSLEGNKGLSTVEIYEDDELIYQNGE